MPSYFLQGFEMNRIELINHPKKYISKIGEIARMFDHNEPGRIKTTFQIHVCIKFKDNSFDIKQFTHDEWFKICHQYKGDLPHEYIDLPETSSTWAIKNV